MKIISGGQTGVDRAALDAAIELGIPHGGWCPRGRTAEDGRIPDRYQLRETDSSDYAFRTEQNVLDSDATLILYRGRISGGTELTLRLARQNARPHQVVDLESPSPPAEVRRWLEEHAVETLNVAGPRESQSPGIAVMAREYLQSVLVRKNDRHGRKADEDKCQGQPAEDDADDPQRLLVVGGGRMDRPHDEQQAKHHQPEVK
jgi:hypothetical protein